MFNLIFAVLLTAIALSLRSQLFYISLLLALIIMIALVYQYIKRKKLSRTLKLFLVLLVGSTFISFIATKYLEVQTSNTTALTIHKRLTFYTGLFDASPTSEWCGSWSPEAVQQAKEEINIPFGQVLLKNIKKMSLWQISEIIQCKWSNYIFEYNSSGIQWLEGHIVNANTEIKIFGHYWDSFKHTEYFAAQILKLVSFSLIFLFIYDIKKFNKSEIVIFGFAIFIVFMFFAIHTILEIQPRYIISPIMIALIIHLHLHSRTFKELSD